VIDSTLPFWDLISSTDKTVVAHAAREEIRFCLRIAKRQVANLFDVQLAAGFVGMEYPASLGTLVSRLEGKTLSKGETRTNWRHRPLSKEQIQYALQDVTELASMYRKLRHQVEQAQRQSWLQEEIQSVQDGILAAEQQENWRRVSGASGLPPRQLEIVRHLWLWRESRAEETDQPARRILRDDLLIELARRQSDDVKKIAHIRGMERRNLHSQYPAIAAAIAAALQTPEDQLPRRPRGQRGSVSPMLSQFLSTSIACVCRQTQMAPAIVGNADDVRELLAYELSGPRSSSKPPALLRGWRGEVIGRSFRGLLAGQLAIRVADVNAEQPLEFIRCDAAPTDQ
jgi:ribonuclease D